MRERVFTESFSCCWEGVVFCTCNMFVFQFKRWSRLSSYLNSTRTKTNPSLTLWCGWSSTVSQQTTPARRRTTSKTMVTTTFFFFSFFFFSSEQMLHTLHQLINNQFLQGSTRCGMRDSSLTSTFQSWSCCDLWWRTMTQHLRMISLGSTAYRSPVYRMVRSNAELEITRWRPAVYKDLLFWFKTEISRLRMEMCSCEYRCSLSLCF